MLKVQIDTEKCTIISSSTFTLISRMLTNTTYFLHFQFSSARRSTCSRKQPGPRRKRYERKQRPRQSHQRYRRKVKRNPSVRQPRRSCEANRNIDEYIRRPIDNGPPTRRHSAVNAPSTSSNGWPVVCKRQCIRLINEEKAGRPCVGFPA